MTINKRGRPIGTRGPAFEHAVQLRSNHPDMTLEAIGNIVGVSKERIRQLLKKAGMETRSSKEVWERRPTHLKFGKPCPTCDKPVPYRRSPSVNTTGYYPKYCVGCEPRYQFVDVSCSYCYKTFKLSKYTYGQKMKRLNEGSQKGIFCSHRCVSGSYWDEVREIIPNEHAYVKKTERDQATWTSFICGICGIESRIRLRSYLHRIHKSNAGILLCSRTCTFQWIKKSRTR